MRDLPIKKNTEPINPPKEFKYLKQRIQESNNKKHEKDITLDLIEFLILKRLNLNQGQTSSVNKKPRALYVVQMISLVVGIIFSLGIAITFIVNSMSEKGDGLFTVHKDCTAFKSIPVYAKEQVMELIIGKIIRITNLIEKYSNTSFLHEKIQPASKNFLFYGKPGTGKTLLIKKLSYFLDIEMRLRRELKKDLRAGRKRNYSYEDLYKVPPAVKLIIVQPSSLIDKYVGSTEKNIKSLFELAIKFSEDCTVLIFIDEVEAFFSERSKNSTEHAMNSKTEFLCSLDGARTDLKSNIYFFGATNLRDHLDSAFLRRLENQIEFTYPDTAELKKFVRKITEGYIWYVEDKIDNIVNNLKGMSHSAIHLIFTSLESLKTEKWSTYAYEDIEKAISDHGNQTKTTDIPSKMNQKVIDNLKYNKIPKISSVS